MAIKQYQESNMSFSFEENDILLPELETWYTRWQGVKMVDFIWKKSFSNLVIIEVKSSCPRFILGNEERVNDYIQELFEKFNAAVYSTYGLTLELSNYNGFTMHQTIHQLETLKRKINIVLVIRNAKNEWLPAIDYGIKTSSLFQNLCKSAGVQFSAMNPEMANKLLGMVITYN